MSVFALRLLLMVGILLAPVIASAADPPKPTGTSDLAALVQGLAVKSFSKKIRAVRRLDASGDERVVPALEALLTRRLYTVKAGGRVVIIQKARSKYKLLHPLTRDETAVVTKSKIRRIRTNNRLRRVIKSVIGGLTLLSDDPARRIAAAKSVLKSRPRGLGPTLEKAVAREKDSNIRLQLELALAATRLIHGKNPDQRVTAVETLSQSTEPEVISLLSGLTAQNKDGTFAESEAKVRTTALGALDAIEDRLALWDFAGKLFQGLSLGSVLLLAAIGLAITFGVMGIINMAHGEMIMLGAYTTFVVQEIFRAHAPGILDMSLIVAIPAAFLVAGSFGIAIERGIIRFLYGRPLETLLATWGLSLVLQQLVRSIFGPTNRDVSSPTWMTGAIELPGGVLLTHNRIWIIVFSLVVVALISLLLKRTAFGLQMRSVTQNRRMAGAMGIRTGRIDALTFGLGSGVAGMAGVALSQVENVSPNLGQAYIVDSFMVVVFGGVGNLMGTLLGATTLGILNKFLEAASGAVIAKIVVLVAVILFIQKRPSGLFALKGRAVEQ